MGVKLRLQRRGATHRPFYHIVAADARSPRDGKFIERVGYYDPTREPSVVEIKEDRVQYWFGKGAVPTNSVKNILEIKKIKLERENTGKR